VDLLPGKADHLDQQALGQPVLAHDPRGEVGAGLGQDEVAIVLVELHETIALHACHRLGHRGTALAEPLGDPCPHRQDPLLRQLVDRPQVHLRGIDEVAHPPIVPHHEAIRWMGTPDPPGASAQDHDCGGLSRHPDARRRAAP